MLDTATMPTSTATHLTAIQEWEHWDEIGKVAHKEYAMSAEDFQCLLPEYQRFLGLIIAGHHGLGMFSADVDKIWHSHILSTLRYQDFCEQFNAGQMIHHLPQLDAKPQGQCSVCQSCKGCSARCNGPSGHDGESRGSLEHFVQAYRAEYGVAPDAVWNLPTTDSIAVQ